MTSLELTAAAFLFAVLAPTVIGIAVLVELIQEKKLFCLIKYHRWAHISASGNFHYEQCERCPKERIVIP